MAIAPKREIGIATAIMRVDLIEPRKRRTIKDARIVPSMMCSCKDLTIDLM